MKYVDFKKFTDENGACPIYLFEGEERYFLEKGVELIKSRFLADATLDFASFEGAQLKGDKIKDLIDAVNCFPFISQKRVVKVSEFYPTEKEYESYLKGYFSNPSQNSILMIVNGSKPQKTSATLSKKQNVTHVDCSRADPETIKKWIYLTCKKEGVFADGITSGKIAEYCVLDMSRIAKETEKLLVYCKVKNIQTLTDELVDEVVYPDSEYKIFELSTAVLRQNYGGYAKILNELLTKGFDELSLLSSLSYAFKTAYEVSSTKGSDKEIASALSLNEYVVKKNREQAARFGREAVYAVYQRIYDAVCRVKSGELSPAGALNAVTSAIFFENGKKTLSF